MTKTWTLITGASSGLGEAFARILACEGRNVLLAARRFDRLEALAAELKDEAGVDAAAIEADLAAPDGARTLWRAATAGGRRVDFLVNNAGLGRHGAFGAGTEADGGWAREKASLDVNVVALTELMNAAVPAMKAAGAGRILNVASLAAFTPGPGMAVYHAGKAYVVSLSRAVGEELRGTGVTVTALCPGATRSEFFDEADMRDARLTKIGKPPSAHDVALYGYVAAKNGWPVAVPGAMNKLGAWTSKVMPAGLVTRLTGFVMAKPG